MSHEVILTILQPAEPTCATCCTFLWSSMPPCCIFKSSSPSVKHVCVYFLRWLWVFMTEHIATGISSAISHCVLEHCGKKLLVHCRDICALLRIFRSCPSFSGARLTTVEALMSGSRETLCNFEYIFLPTLSEIQLTSIGISIQATLFALCCPGLSVSL